MYQFIANNIFFFHLTILFKQCFQNLTNLFFKTKKIKKINWSNNIRVNKRTINIKLIKLVIETKKDN